MEKQAQNIQESFLNNARKDKTFLTIYLMSGVKLSGKIKSFDKYSVVLETNNQEQLIFKHAISTVVVSRPFHSGRRECIRAPRPAGTPLPELRASRPVNAGKQNSRKRRLSTEIALLVGLKLSGRKARSAAVTHQRGRIPRRIGGSGRHRGR